MLGAFAQQIDKQEEDGSRLIVSGGENLYSTFSTGAGFDLRVNVLPDGEKLWRFCVTTNEGKGTIDSGRVILIKFEDGSVMELRIVIRLDPLTMSIRLPNMVQITISILIILFLKNNYKSC